jgi:hypothetical protein
MNTNCEYFLNNPEDFRKRAAATATGVRAADSGFVRPWLSWQSGTWAPDRRDIPGRCSGACHWSWACFMKKLIATPNLLEQNRIADVEASVINVGRK